MLDEDGNSTGETELCGLESFPRGVITVTGWTVTAGALAMGATFWFATLKRAVGLRKRDST